MGTNLFGKGLATHGNIPASLHEMGPLADDARRLALDGIGVSPADLTASFVLLGRLHEANRESEVLAALTAVSFAHEITPVVDAALSDQGNGDRVDEPTAAIGVLVSEVGLVACDPSVPHSNPIKIRGHDRWHAIGHPAAGSMLVTERGLSSSVATIVGNRHRHGPDVAHGTGGLSRELRPTADVSAAAQDLAGFHLRGSPQSESNLTAQAVRQLFDDPGVYGTQGPELADAVCERFGLPRVGTSTKPPSLGVGVLETSGDLTHVAIRPDMGDSSLLLPFHADHFDSVTDLQERVFGTIVTRAIGAGI